MFIPYMPLRQV